MSWISFARWSGVSCLVALIVLRIAWPGFNLHSPLPWAMAFAWPLITGTAIVFGRAGVVGNPQSAWGVLLLMTSLILGVATMLAIGLPLSAERASLGPELAIGSLVFVAALIATCVGWWRVFRRDRPAIDVQAHGVRRWLLIAGCVALVCGAIASVVRG